MTMPTVVAPAPMPVVPVPMMPAPMAVMPTTVAMIPVHLLGLQATDLVTGGDGRMRIAIGWRACVVAEGKRCERRRLDGRCEGGRTGGDSEGHLQKIAAFHERFPLLLGGPTASASFFPAT